MIPPDTNFDVTTSAIGFSYGRYVFGFTWTAHEFLFGVTCPPGVLHLHFGPFGIVVFWGRG